MKIKDTIQLFRSELKDIYSADEIENYIFYSMNEYLGFSRRHLQLKAEQPLAETDVRRFQTIVKELKSHKPIQYIIGHTEFYGYKIRVNEHVLIPRPETEELVEYILQVTRDACLPDRQEGREADELNIIDLCTGSGCIAIALKKNLPEATVSAMDISDEALLVAKANSILNQTKINFLQGDVLELNHSTNQQFNNFNIIVSNPPYVRESEKGKMSKNVLNYEPHLALFVKNEDALVFYKAIADFALQNLAPDGKLYFEINESLGVEVKKMLEEKGFKNVEVKKDISGKERIAVGSRQ